MKSIQHLGLAPFLVVVLLVEALDLLGDVVGVDGAAGEGWVNARLAGCVVFWAGDAAASELEMVVTLDEVAK